MNKRIMPVVFVFFLSLIILYHPHEVAAESEDTAHLNFEKTAALKKDDGTYVVKKGDWLANIVRKELGSDVSYSDINRIILKIKQLNPNITNLNVIKPGQILNMPPSSSAAITQAGKTLNDGNADTQAEKQSLGKPDIFVKDVKYLAILKHIITNMRGTVSTDGLFHIPLPQNGQVTIDCDKIPVIEFDDGSTVLIDFSNNMPSTLRKLIQTKWKHYRIIKYKSQDDISVVLQKIINSSHSYNMVKMAKFFNITNKPQVQLYSDWVIEKKISQGQRQSIQALSFLKDDSQLIPRPIVNYADRNGLIITEIVDNLGLLKSQPLGELKSDITNLNASTNKELIAALLTTLGYKLSKNADLNIYNQIKESGFNFTIKVDYLLKKDNTQYIIHSQVLSEEVIDILKGQGSVIIQFNQKEMPNSLIERLLRTMSIPFSYNTFTFTMPEKGLARAAINIPAFRISDNPDEPIFLIDFDMDHELYTFIQSIWRLKIVKY